jgi:hypothetical protein
MPDRGWHGSIGRKRRDWPVALEELRDATHFLRRVRHDFETRDAIDRGELDPELECTCNLCWGENFASIRALQTIAAPGMSEDELAHGVWEWMHTEGQWAWKRSPT